MGQLAHMVKKGRLQTLSVAGSDRNEKDARKRGAVPEDAGSILGRNHERDGLHPLRLFALASPALNTTTVQCIER